MAEQNRQGLTRKEQKKYDRKVRRNPNADISTKNKMRRNSNRSDNQRGIRPACRT
jgi:hypothetical protein